MRHYTIRRSRWSLITGSPPPRAELCSTFTTDIVKIDQAIKRLQDLPPNQRTQNPRVLAAIPPAIELARRQSVLLQMPIQLGVQPTIGNQLLMVAIFGNAAAVEYQHSIGLFNRG